MREIQLVHLSDIHVKDDRVSEFKRRVEALFSDLDSLCVHPDFLVVSGDISFSGKKEEFELADKILFAPFKEKYGIANGQMIFAMGNHDIDRKEIDSLTRDGLLKQITEYTESPYEIPESRFGASTLAFRSFNEKYCGSSERTYGATVESIEGVRISLASINSALTCMDMEHPQGKLHLTRKQVDYLVEKSQGCALRIGIMHHPLEWLTPLDQESNIPDILRSMQIILTGHLHKTSSQAKKTPVDDNIILAATSFFAGAVSPRDTKDGYNVYTIDPKKNCIRVNYRMYVRDRSEFDANVEHARGGVWMQELPKKFFNNQENLPVLRNATGVADKLLTQMNESLRTVQRVESPIYIAPPLIKIDNSSSQRHEKIAVCRLESLAHLNFFFTPCDVGATSFFEEFCVRINRDESSKMLAVYLQEKDLKGIASDKDILTVVSSKYSVAKSDLNLGSLCIVLDDVCIVNSEQINDLLARFNSAGKVLIGIRSKVLFVALQNGLQVQDVAFFEFRYWGPEKIREFVGKYLQVQGVAQSHSIDAAINFVIKSFSDSDINMTPLLVGLYLRVFCRSAQKISGVSFLELLQELETYGFSKVRNSLTNTRYYFKRFLMRLAISCYRARTLSVELVPLKDEFSDLFLKAAIPDDVASLLEALQETGIVAISDSKISFSCFVFFWYYLAQAFNEDNELLKDALSNDVSLIVAGGAIAYYAGEKRDNLNIISELLAAMKRRRPMLLNVTLADFEKYANKFLLPPDEPDADAQVEELSRKSNSAVLSEEEFASEKEIMRKTTERFFRYMPGKTVFSDFDADAQILKTIYNSFRNLEVIPAADKEYILDLTLNYHLDSNFRIIKFLAEMVRGEGEHVSSFVAYVVAIAGATLLSDNIASEQLCTTLERVYEKTASPLKRFLIICIMQELGMEDISDRLVELLKETRSFPLTELGYFVLRYDLIMYDKKRIPDRLRLAFKEVCAMRNRARGVHEYQRINSDFNAEWNQVETLRLGNVKDRIVNG